MNLLIGSYILFIYYEYDVLSHVYNSVHCEFKLNCYSFATTKKEYTLYCLYLAALYERFFVKDHNCPYVMRKVKEVVDVLNGTSERNAFFKLTLSKRC
jgi:hypothetical protein